METFLKAVGPIALLAAALVVAAFALAWRTRRTEELARAWAAAEGFELLEVSYSWLWRGPFWLRSTEGQSVARIVVRLPDGTRRTGWLRCGGWWFGLWSDATQVRWDDA